MILTRIPVIRATDRREPFIADLRINSQLIELIPFEKAEGTLKITLESVLGEAGRGISC